MAKKNSKRPECKRARVERALARMQAAPYRYSLRDRETTQASLAVWQRKAAKAWAERNPHPHNR